MNCEDARDALLEADLPLAHEQENSTLLQHLRGCASCTSVAESLETRHMALLADYQDLRPRRQVDEAVTAVFDVARVRAMSPASPEVGGRHSTVLSLARKRRGLAAKLVIGAAIAAAVTLLVLQGDDDKSISAGDPQSTGERVPISVEVPENQNAIVFETRNPNITVVWIYSGD